MNYLKITYPYRKVEIAIGSKHAQSIRRFLKDYPVFLRSIRNLPPTSMNSIFLNLMEKYLKGLLKSTKLTKRMKVKSLIPLKLVR